MTQQQYQQRDARLCIHPIHDERLMSTSAPCVYLHELVEKQAALTPLAICISHRSESVTYQTLNEQATGLARRLRQQGVGPNVLVGIMARREPATIVFMLAVLKAQGAYVPIDPTYPADRIEHILTDARLTLLLVRQASDVPSIPPTVRVLVIDEFDSGADKAGPFQFIDMPPECPALVIYTSGSTGRPKGVIISHRAAVSRTVNGYKYRKGDLQKFSLSVIAHLADVFRPLVAGGVVVLVPDEVVRDPSAFCAAIRLHGTTRLVFVPSHLQALLEGDPHHVEALRSLDTIIVSGEALTPSVVQAVKTMLPHVALLNSYGLSEMAGLVCMGEVHDAALITVGHPLPGIQMHILDEERNPVATGQQGEIYIGGAQVASGYLNQDTATAERFVTDPFGRPGERMYRTGDAGRRHADGKFELCGRWDDQVKVRGFRVSLSEIEAVLRRLPEVEKAVVLVQSLQEQQTLTAYVLPKMPVRETQLRQAVADRLPLYMVPARFVRIAQLPLLPNGKVDRVRLAETAAIDHSFDPDDAPCIAPRTATELQIIALWSDAFPARKVSVQDNLFDLGGDSLVAMRLLSRLEAIYDAEITYRDLLEHPTPETLGREVDARLRLAQH